MVAWQIKGFGGVLPRVDARLARTLGPLGLHRLALQLVREQPSSEAFSSALAGVQSFFHDDLIRLMVREGGDKYIRSLSVDARSWMERSVRADPQWTAGTTPTTHAGGDVAAVWRFRK